MLPYLSNKHLSNVRRNQVIIFVRKCSLTLPFFRHQFHQQQIMRESLQSIGKSLLLIYGPNSFAGYLRQGRGNTQKPIAVQKEGLSFAFATSDPFQALNVHQWKTEINLTRCGPLAKIPYTTLHFTKSRKYFKIFQLRQGNVLRSQS